MCVREIFSKSHNFCVDVCRCVVVGNIVGQTIMTAQDIKGVLRALLARRPRRRRGTIDKSAIYPHTSK